MTMITMERYVEFKGIIYDQRHGGPFDRGASDSYYGRGPLPHYFEGATYASKEVLVEEGTPAWEEYMAGYEYNERHGSKKEW